MKLAGIERVFLSTVATRGEMIQVTSLADPGQEILAQESQAHTEATRAEIAGEASLDTGIDIITIAAVNNDAVDRTLHIQWSSGGAANRISMVLPTGAGLISVIEERRIARGLPIYAWASAASVINVLFHRDPLLVKQ